MAPHEVPIAMDFKLRDGTPVVIRPIFPEDRDRLREGMHRLSQQSRYRRFGATVSELTEDQLSYLTEIDHANHMAWIALDPNVSGEPGLGVARYVRLTEEPEVAEAAVIVSDNVQGLGLGTILLSLLGVSALTNGIRTFRAYVLVENRVMLEILREMGGNVTLEEPGVYRVDLPLSEDPDDIPDTPTGRVFKAVAKRVVPPLEVLRRTMPDSPG
jgi:RimJ/RimL family protein N-acetyltransferase